MYFLAALVRSHFSEFHCVLQLVHLITTSYFLVIIKAIPVQARRAPGSLGSQNIQTVVTRKW
jgi:hypothetical protein